MKLAAKDPEKLKAEIMSSQHQEQQPSKPHFPSFHYPADFSFLRTPQTSLLVIGGAQNLDLKGTFSRAISLLIAAKAMCG